MGIRTLVNQLINKALTLATAESCTGGLIANTLTDIPGSSAFFKGGIVAYANEAKIAFLGVPDARIHKYGAVSKTVAKAMAQGARQQFKTDFGLSTTGIAGPTGGTKTKPIGLVFIALATKKKTIIKKCFFIGTRLSIKKQVCQTALRLLNQNIRSGYCYCNIRDKTTITY